MSAPAPPASESAFAEPMSVVAAPLLVTLNPEVPAVTADRFTACPFVLKLAVPELLLADVAAQATVTVAFAVAPELTTNTSAPPVPRSVTLSLPDAMMKVSKPAPPVRLSLPKPPSSVSAPAPPASESAFAEPMSVVAAPLLVTLNPEVPAVTADRFTACPFVLKLAVPELLLADVAAQATVTVAFAVAPELTLSTSRPSPRSLIESTPAEMSKMSAPSPPAKESFPGPPRRVSMPLPPSILSSSTPP